jgi:hypothetical protein
MNNTVRRIAASVAGSAAAAAGLLVLSAAPPAQAATLQTSGNGQVTILLSDQDVLELTSGNPYDVEAVCEPLADEVTSQRKAAGAGRPFDFYDCKSTTARCIGTVGAHTQINLFADNSYSCTTYSTDGTLFSQLGGLIFP